MRNRNILIAGEPGAGKTSLARALFTMAMAPRVVVIDPIGEYDLPNGNITTSLAETIAFIREYREEDYSLVFRPQWDDAAEAELLVKYIHAMQLQYDLPALLLGLEEATTYGETHSISPAIKRAYTKGRHARLNIITITQVDTEIHRIVRFCSQIWVSLRAAKLSSDMAARFDRSEVSALEPLTPDVTPEKGRHFITYPSTADIFGELADVLAL